MKARENVGIDRERRFRSEPFDEIELPTQEWLVKGLVPRSGIGFLASPSGGGKSFLALDWAMSVAAGRSILDNRTRQAGVVYVAAEGEMGVRKRIMAQKQEGQLAGLPFEMIGQTPNLLDPAQVQELIAEIEDATARIHDQGARLGLVIIDTLAACAPGADENYGRDMSQVISALQHIGHRTGAFVLVVAHTGKDEDKGIRGWSGQFAAADMVIMIARPPAEPETRTGHVAKLKDGQDGRRFAFCLETVDLGMDDDGDPISSARVAYVDFTAASSRPKQRPMKEGQQVMLQAINYVTDHGPTYDPPGGLPGVQGWQRAVKWEDVRERALASGFAAEGVTPSTLKPAAWAGEGGPKGPRIDPGRRRTDMVVGSVMVAEGAHVQI